jgi:PAS domain S-box-containing protein
MIASAIPDHSVQFYEGDEFLLARLTDYLLEGFAQDVPCLVIATPSHREALIRKLADLGWDHRVLESGLRLLLLDASETLAMFMRNGQPDESLFRSALDSILTLSGYAGRPVRAFGEMVALLWLEGNEAAAVKLEDLWDGYLKGSSIKLLCAYPILGTKGLHSIQPFARICCKHSHIIPSESYSSPSLGDEDRNRSIAILQQKAATLEVQTREMEAQLGKLRELHDVSRTFTALVNSSNDAIISKDLNARITSWNKAAERIFGYTAEEVLGKSITILIPPNHLNEEPQILERIRRGETVNHYETIRRRKDGTLLNISLTVSPISDEEGNIIGASKIARDITSVKATEDQLRQAQKMEAVGRLAGGIAHDFNNLLTSINGFTDLAMMQLGHDHPIAEYLQEVRNSGERAATLTQQLLAYSRKQILSLKVLDLNVTVAEMEKMLHRLIGEDVLFSTDLDPGLGRVKADPGQIQQIILNLILNARDAMPNGGSIALTTANVTLDLDFTSEILSVPSGNYVMLAVSDTGMGMTPEVQAHIFEPFFTTKEVGKGTGLGLSSVYGIVKQSGGGIAVSSHPGRGTVIRIYLPLVEAKTVKEPARVSKRASAMALSGETILLAEDEDTVRKFLSTTLRNNGYKVIEARDGIEALEIGNRESRIDLLMTDVVMPNMNGGKLAEEIKASHPGLKILFMSGYTKDVLTAKTPLDSDIRFLQKPFTQMELLARVREAIGKPVEA